MSQTRILRYTLSCIPERLEVVGYELRAAHYQPVQPTQIAGLDTPGVLILVYERTSVGPIPGEENARWVRA
jgi:hypothetical protein